MDCKCYSSISEITPELWDSVFQSDYPFVQHSFLLALEESGCVSAKTGWQAVHLMLRDGNQVLGAMPTYLKSHSQGEFVFDWAWAEAYARHGLSYYPKLVTAIPFSPVVGPRIGVAPPAKSSHVFPALINAAQQWVVKRHFSGWHLLFPDREQQALFTGMEQQESVLRREAVQFHWLNHNFGTFNDFLATLRSSRRKTIKRERRKVAEQGLGLQRKTGAEISDEDWHGFYRCYVDTYRKRSGHDGYLNRKFFDLIRQSMAEQLMLVVARKDSVTVATSLFLFDSETLYGRYWGALKDFSCLHFEACLYQGIEFCIERGLKKFDPGTQGEHKLIRGFEPIRSISYHWLQDKQFRQAVADFLRVEKRGMDDYQRQAERILPYKSDNSG